MDKYEIKCKALLESGRDQQGHWAEPKDCELSFYKRMFHYYKKHCNSLYSQPILDQQDILKELKETKDNLILERNHNKRLKEQNEILRNTSGRQSDAIRKTQGH